MTSTTSPTAKPLSFQDIILTLQQFWGSHGCALLQPYDLEVGAGTSSPNTLLRTLDDRPWNCAYVQPSRRPTDGRYGDNPNRLYQHHQFQVIMQPSPPNIQDLYLESLKKLGLDPLLNDIRFVEDDWENPTLGAWGLGWEVWCNGMEITQYTYFQQVGGFDCKPVAAELTYGLERMAMYIQNVENVYDLDFNGRTDERALKYGDVFKRNEFEQSKYSFELADVETLERHFADAEAAAKTALDVGLAIPAYEQCLKAGHAFNLLNARGVIGQQTRPAYIGRVRDIARECCKVYLENQ